MSNVWDAVDAGVRTGGALSKAYLDRKRQEAYGKSYQEGGWGGVAKTAGGMGDLETAAKAETDQWEGSKRNLTALGNIVRSIGSMPYEARKQRIGQIAPMLEKLGLPRTEIEGYDPTDENNQALLAQLGQYNQYVEYKQGKNGELYGVKADGSTDTLHAPPPEPMEIDQGNQITVIDKNNPNTDLRTFDKGPAPRAPGSSDAEDNRHFSNAQQLSDDFRQQVKPYENLADTGRLATQYQPIFAAGKRDPQLEVVIMMKVIGGLQTGVLSDRDIATGSGGTLPTNIAQMYDFATGKSTLSAKQVGGLIHVAQVLDQNARTRVKGYYDNVKNIAKARGIPEDYIFGVDPMTTMFGPAPGAPTDIRPPGAGADDDFIRDPVTNKIIPNPNKAR